MNVHEKVAAVGGSLDKQDLIAKHFATLVTAEDRYLTARLLLPSKNYDQRAPRAPCPHAAVTLPRRRHAELESKALQNATRAQS